MKTYLFSRSKVQQRTSGFTIVELLIVIVVIAILAAISITVFTGIQDRARNTARISDVKKMKSLLEQYMVINGSAALSLMIPEGYPVHCLGEGYIDLDPGLSQGCYNYFDTYQNINYPTNSIPALDNALKALGNYSVSSLPPVSTGEEYTHWQNGNTYYYQEDYSAPHIVRLQSNYLVDGTPGFIQITYVLEGDDTDCGLRPLMDYVGYSNGIYSYVTNSSDKNGGYYNGMTWCYLHISRS